MRPPSLFQRRRREARAAASCTVTAVRGIGPSRNGSRPAANSRGDRSVHFSEYRRDNAADVVHLEPDIRIYNIGGRPQRRLEAVNELKGAAHGDEALIRAEKIEIGHLRAGLDQFQLEKIVETSGLPAFARDLTMSNWIRVFHLDKIISAAGDLPSVNAPNPP